MRLRAGLPQALPPEHAAAKRARRLFGASRLVWSGGVAAVHGGYRVKKKAGWVAPVRIDSQAVSVMRGVPRAE